MATKVDMSDPNIKKLVYNMYRGMLGNYNDKANVIVDAMPRSAVTQDVGISKQIEQMMRQSSQISGGSPSPGVSTADVAPSFGAPPPPPPPGIGALPTTRINTEIPDNRGREPPAVVLNAMMSKDKKPFTYTPGGLDLSQIRSPRMQRRISRNAAAEGVAEQPAKSANSLAASAPPQHQPQIAVPVFPPAPPPPPPANINKDAPPPPPPPGNFSKPGGGDAPPPPPPQQQVGSAIGGGFSGHPQIVIPKNPVLRPTGLRNDRQEQRQPSPPQAASPPAPPPQQQQQRPPPQQQIQQQQPEVQSPPVSRFGQRQTTGEVTPPPQMNYTQKSQDFSPRGNNVAAGAIYVPPATPRAQLGSLYIPPLEVASPVSSSPSPVTLNKAPTPWMSAGPKQTTQAPAWASREATTSPAAASGTRIIPIQMECRESSSPIQQQQQYQQQQQQQQQLGAGTRIIPIQIEGAPPLQKQQQQNYQQQQQQQFQQQQQQYQQQQQQQQPRPQRQMQPVYVHNKFNPVTPPGPAYQVEMSSPDVRQQQQGWSGAPIQSRSFKVLQKITGSEGDEEQDEQGVREHQSDQYHQNPQQWGPQNTQGVPISQLNKLQLSDDDRALMNKFKAQVDDDNYLHTEADPRYRGAAIPSRAFRMLQTMTDTAGDVPRGPTPSGQQRVQQPAVDSPAQPYIPACEQKVQEPRKYTGGAIPSRSFRILQAMTAPENCANDYAPDQVWGDPNASPVPYYPSPQNRQDYWGYNGENQPYWDPYSYMAYVNEMNAAYGYPPIPYPPAYSPYPQQQRYSHCAHPNGSDSDEYSGYSSTDEMAYYGQNFQRPMLNNMYQRQGMVSRGATDTPSKQYTVEVPVEENRVDHAMYQDGVEILKNDDVVKNIVMNELKETKVNEKISVKGRDVQGEEDDSDTEVEDDEEDKVLGISAIKSVSNIHVYKNDTGVMESNDDDTEHEESEEEEEDEDEEEEEEEEDEEEEVQGVEELVDDLPHQLSVIYEESEFGSDAGSVRRGVKSAMSEDDSSTATLDNDVESDGNDDIDSESSSVTVRLPLKLKFSRSANDEEVTTVIVGDSEVNKSIGITSESIAEPQLNLEEHLKKELPKLLQLDVSDDEDEEEDEDEETDEEEFAACDPDISVTFSIPSRSNSTNKVEQWRKAVVNTTSPVRYLTPSVNRQECATPNSMIDVSRQQSTDDLDAYATCESDSDVSVCLSLKVRTSPKPDREDILKTDSQSSSGSTNTVKTLHKSEDSCSEMESAWTVDDEVKPEPEVKGFWEVDEEDVKIPERKRPSLEIDIEIKKNVQVPIEEEESDESSSDEESDLESSCSSDSSCSAKSCVVIATSKENLGDVKLENQEEIKVTQLNEVVTSVVAEVKKVETSEEESEGEYKDEEENIISKIYNLCLEDNTKLGDGEMKVTKSPSKEKVLSRNSSESGEEDDSGVTSDMSRHISDTESDMSDQRKQTKYIRASTHSRLFRLLQGECDKSDDEDNEKDATEETKEPTRTLNSRREHLTLPLKTTNTLSDPDSLSSSSGVNSPASPTVTDRLVKELVQSLLQRKKGKRLKKLPMAKLHAAALRILQEDMDPYDTGSSAGSEDNCLSPARRSAQLPNSERTAISPQATPYGANYYDYCDYYNTWANAAYYGEENYDILPSRAFKLLSEHASQPSGITPGLINGLWAKCPRIPSGKNVRMMMKLHEDSLETNPSSSEPPSPLSAPVPKAT